MRTLIPLRVIDLLSYEFSIARDAVFDILDQHDDFPVFLFKTSDKESVPLQRPLIPKNWTWWAHGSNLARKQWRDNPGNPFKSNSLTIGGEWLYCQPSLHIYIKMILL